MTDYARTNDSDLHGYHIVEMDWKARNMKNPVERNRLSYIWFYCSIACSGTIWLYYYGEIIVKFWWKHEYVLKF